MINIYAPLNTLGYGIHAANIIKGLKDKGKDYNIIPIGAVQSDPYFESYFKEGVNRRLEFRADSPSLFIFHDEFSIQSCGSPLLTFSVFETDKIGDLNKTSLNNGPTSIVVTTTQKHKELLENNGITKPIEVVNEGIDDSLFNTIPYDPLIDTGKFTYITVGKREKRKNTDLILEVWVQEMKDKEVALIAHTFNPFIHKDQNSHPFTNLACWTSLDPRSFGLEYKGFNGKSHFFTNGSCDIYFTVPGIPLTSMPSLYHSANVGIAVSRGEGWDLPLTEMMACGIPCIATDCLGHVEYLSNAPDIQQALQVKVKESEIAEDGIWFKGDKGNWSTIDKSEIKDKIVYTYNHKEEYKDKSEELADYMCNNYSWGRSVDDLLKIIKE